MARKRISVAENPNISTDSNEHEVPPKRQRKSKISSQSVQEVDISQSETTQVSNGGKRSRQPSAKQIVCTFLDYHISYISVIVANVCAQ